MLDYVYELCIMLILCSMKFIYVIYQDSVCTSQRSKQLGFHYEDRSVLLFEEIIVVYCVNYTKHGAK